MSSKKDKLVEEAQRLALRGQFDKAIKAYQQVLALEPSAINQRQKLAELLVKAGRPEDARTEFETIGRNYANNGFYLKAIAVYKKLQVMFPGDISITLNLAGLNEKHGLVANALAEYKQVYDHYEKTSNTEEALKILDRMQEVDKQNVGIKLKLAEAYFLAGKKDQSYAAFSRLAALLQERGDAAAVNKLNVRIQQLFPQKTGFMLEMLAEQMAAGNAGSAVSGLQALLRNNPKDKGVWELVVQAYQRLGQGQRLKAACQHFLKFFPGEPTAVRGMAECLVAEKDVRGAIAHLQRYEQEPGTLPPAVLVSLYTELDQLEPFNVEILTGLKKAYEAAGDVAGAAAVGPKIETLRSVSGAQTPDLQPAAEPEGCGEEQTAEIPPPAGAETAGADETAAVPESSLPAAEQEMPVSGPLDFVAPELDDDIEIEIEIEIDDEGASQVEADAGAADLPSGVATDAWLDSVGEIFDTIATAPRSVKFGSDLDSSDAQSHYDLGVAFREMGLYDEAINEFRHAADAPDRKVECLVLQGACLREKGEVAKAESLLRSLQNPGLNLEDSCLVKYELALTYEIAAKGDDAARLLAEIDAASPGFRDVRSRLDAAGSEASLDFSDEDLQGFDLK